MPYDQLARIYGADIGERCLRALIGGFRGGLAIVSSGVGGTPPRGTFVWANAEYHRLVGRARLAGTRFQDITPDPSLSEDLRYLTQIDAGQRDDYHMEKAYSLPDESRRHVTMSVFAIGDSRPPSCYLVVAIDRSAEVLARMLAERDAELALRRVAAYTTLDQLREEASSRAPTFRQRERSLEGREQAPGGGDAGSRGNDDVGA